MDTSSTAYLLGALVGAVAAGGLCGLLPYKVALTRGRNRLALGSMIACILAGLVLGLALAIPVAIGLSITALVMGNRDAARAQPTPAATHSRRPLASAMQPAMADSIPPPV